jgi:hypothetical protein
VQTFFTQRAYRSMHGMSYVRGQAHSTMGPVEPPIPMSYFPNEYPVFWTVGGIKYDGYKGDKTPSQLWVNEPFVKSAAPLILQRDTPGWKAGFHWLSAGSLHVC